MWLQTGVGEARWGAAPGSRGTLCGGQRGPRPSVWTPRGRGGEGEASTVLSSQPNYRAALLLMHRVLLYSSSAGPCVSARVCVCPCARVSVHVCTGAPKVPEVPSALASMQSVRNGEFCPAHPELWPKR